MLTNEELLANLSVIDEILAARTLIESAGYVAIKPAATATEWGQDIDGDRDPTPTRNKAQVHGWMEHRQITGLPILTRTVYYGPWEEIQGGDA